MPRFASITCAVLLTVAPFSASVVHAESTTDTTIPVLETSDTSPYNNLQNEPALCVNSNPRPGCGMKPQASGDRGGWMQYTVFGVMIAALSVIGTVLVRNVIKRDRAISAQVSDSEK
jgi:hypothetical protein